MNPLIQIGRYKLPLLNVAAIEERQFSGWRKLLLRLGLARRGYDVLLANGRVIHFTHEEKEAYDKAMNMHDLTLYFYGMAKGLGLRG